VRVDRRLNIVDRYICGMSSQMRVRRGRHVYWGDWGNKYYQLSYKIEYFLLCMSYRAPRVVFVLRGITFLLPSKHPISLI
jgi:hypothetical protein